VYSRTSILIVVKIQVTKSYKLQKLSKLFFIELGKLIFLYEITDFNITINK